MAETCSCFVLTIGICLQINLCRLQNGTAGLILSGTAGLILSGTYRLSVPSADSQHVWSIM
jgi:hypothetical protein